ncbi:MAG: hypothetical protein ACHQQR_14245, partial [Gemmatimonadales bacterium]
MTELLVCRRRIVRALATGLSMAATLARSAGAQVAPDLHWRTITTEHFHVNFGPGLEPVARRAAGSIERAYG